jgi:plastocyanin
MKKSFPLAIGIAALFSFGELIAACTSSSMIPEPAFGSDAGASDATTFADGAPIADAAIPPSDSGSPDSGGPTPIVDSGPFDAGPKPLINGCFSFTDNTASGVASLDWGFNIESDVNHCSKIAVGQSVTWTGDFVTHPLGPYDDTQAGGVPTNGDPIVLPASPGGSVTINFPTAGTYGYWCMVHQTMMMGAIQVQ